MTYVDLGLTSGTLWASKNAPGLFSYPDACAKFGTNLPMKQHFNELFDECLFEYTQGSSSNYVKVIGPNGNSVILPIQGYWPVREQRTYLVDGSGHYWTRTPKGPKGAWFLCLIPFNEYISVSDRENGYSVRLIKSK